MSRLPAVAAADAAARAPAAESEGERHPRFARGVPGPELDADALAWLAPDPVLVRGNDVAAGPGDVGNPTRRLHRNRPRTLVVEPATLAELWRDVRRVAEALAVPERGVQLVARLQRRMQAIAARAATLPRPSLACLDGLDPPRAAGDWTTELVTMAGAESVPGRPVAGLPRDPFEALVESDPDAIFVAPRGLRLAAVRAAMPALERRPEWPRLRAVRKGRVYLADGRAHFRRPGPRVVETLEVLAEALHPGAFRFAHEGVSWERRRAAAVVTGSAAQIARNSRRDPADDPREPRRLGRRRRAG